MTFSLYVRTVETSPLEIIARSAFLDTSRTDTAEDVSQSPEPMEEEEEARVIHVAVFRPPQARVSASPMSRVATVTDVDREHFIWTRGTRTDACPATVLE